MDAEAGDLMKNDHWVRLITARKVVGGHGGPPCETYTSARWNQVEGMECPQLLRDAQMPWGRMFLSFSEMQQCYTGTILRLTTLRLLLLIFVHGGSISLEHPRGSEEDVRQWSIWQSAYMKWLLLDSQIRTVTFLQGPLGRRFAKPTTMMVGRLPWFASMIFSHNDKNWRATEVLGGREGKRWKTTKAKEYPVKMSKVIAQAHLRHCGEIEVEGTEKDPDGLQDALRKLVGVHDPYDIFAASTHMMSDYHARKI